MFMKPPPCLESSNSCHKSQIVCQSLRSFRFVKRPYRCTYGSKEIVKQVVDVRFATDVLLSYMYIACHELEKIIIAWNITYFSSSVMVCNPLGSPLYGQVICTAGNIYGSRCSYSCHTGYILTTGSSSRTCQSNGVFSGSTARCAGKKT